MTDTDRITEMSWLDTWRVTRWLKLSCKLRWHVRWTDVSPRFDPWDGMCWCERREHHTTRLPIWSA